MGQHQVKGFADRGKSGRNSRSITKSKESEKPELPASGKPNDSHVE